MSEDNWNPREGFSSDQLSEIMATAQTRDPIAGLTLRNDLAEKHSPLELAGLVVFYAAALADAWDAPKKSTTPRKAKKK